MPSLELGSARDTVLSHTQSNPENFTVLYGRKSNLVLLNSCWPQCDVADKADFRSQDSKGHVGTRLYASPLQSQFSKRGILYPVSGQNVETVLSRQWHSLLVVGKTIQAGGTGTIV